MVYRISIVVVIITAAIFHLLGHYLSGPPAASAPMKQQQQQHHHHHQGPAPDQAPSRICEAHLASVAVATVSGARDLTSMAHELLNLDLTAYPFEDVDALVNSCLRPTRDLKKVVLDAYMRETDGMYASYSAASGAGTDDGGGDMRARRERALRLSVMIFSDMVARIEYLRKVWPAMEEAARACKPKHGKDCRQSRKVAYIDQWCRAHGIQVDRAESRKTTAVRR
jgi:hypothetical protein